MSTQVVSIRRARQDDAEMLSEVFDAAWREAYQGIIPGVALDRMLARRGPAWWRSTAGRNRPLVVLEVGEAVVGYVSYGRCRDRALKAEGEIDEIYLAPSYQGLGYGRRLFNAVRNDLRDRDVARIAVWSLADNHRARDFYEHLGGQVVAQATDRIAGARLSKVAYLFA
ncbi:GNAT family N-acetyltransferase [Methylobacterium sp. ID0610]|uniref:GNAT family N-acetyltransferase n=1 Tax=Methylobacterium carpenticola TaxID=3344827 RepID=UPI0036C2AF67